jgi:hypothetical protein
MAAVSCPPAVFKARKLHFSLVSLAKTDAPGRARQAIDFSWLRARMPQKASTGWRRRTSFPEN